MTKRKELAIERLTIAAINLIVLDENLTAWERERADEIYALCNELEDGPGAEDALCNELENAS